MKTWKNKNMFTIFVFDKGRSSLKAGFSKKNAAVCHVLSLVENSKDNDCREMSINKGHFFGAGEHKLIWDFLRNFRGRGGGVWLNK